MGGGGDDVWSKGTKGVEGLNQSGEASAAAAATVSSYKSTAETSLAGVDPVFAAAVTRWNAILTGVNSSQSITPKFGAAPTVGKGASLSSVQTKQAEFSDGNNFQTV